MLQVALLFLFPALAASRPTAIDTIPNCAQVENGVQPCIPSGRDYDRLRSFLAWLQPRPDALQQDADATPDGIPRREIDGLVVDETQTKLGRDFYDVFYANWQAPPGAMNYTIRVQEQPSPSLGTRIVVTINDEPLFQLQLQPRYEVIEDLAQQAALYTRKELESRQPAALPAAAGSPASGGGSGR